MWENVISHEFLGSFLRKREILFNTENIFHRIVLIHAFGCPLSFSVWRQKEKPSRFITKNHFSIEKQYVVYIECGKCLPNPDTGKSFERGYPLGRSVAKVGIFISHPHVPSIVQNVSIVFIQLSRRCPKFTKKLSWFQEIFNWLKYSSIFGISWAKSSS